MGGGKNLKNEQRLVFNTYLSKHRYCGNTKQQQCISKGRNRIKVIDIRTDQLWVVWWCSRTEYPNMEDGEPLNTKLCSWSRLYPAAGWIRTRTLTRIRPTNMVPNGMQNGENTVGQEISINTRGEQTLKPDFYSCILFNWHQPINLICIHWT